MVEKNNCEDSSITVRRRSSVASGSRMKRQQSITRGTASSIAKMVRPQDHDQPQSHHYHHHHNNNSSNSSSKNKKKRNSGIPTKNQSVSKDHEEEDLRRNSWCPTTKKRISRLSPDHSYSHIVNLSNDRIQYKRDSIDSLTTSTTASSHEEDYIPKPTRSIKPFPKISKSFRDKDDVLPLDNDTPDCKQKSDTDLALEEKKKNKHFDDFHNARMPHCMTLHKSCTSQQSLSENASSLDDDSPTTPIDSHQIEKIEKSSQKEEEEFNQISEQVPTSAKVALTNQLDKFEGCLKKPLSELTTTTYSNTIIHHTKQKDDKLCSDLSQQLWKDVEKSDMSDKWIRLKWNLGQWMSTLVTTGEIRDKDYDDYGHPKNIVISGICVTTEPGLLPKRLLQFNKQELVHHSYLLELSRQKRLEHFQMINKSQWVSDTQVSMCEFSHNLSKHCTVKFNMFNRRHHCRSCGHIFCQSHSANRLALFHSNDSGEWVRVCDSCLYSRVKPFLK